MSGKNVDWEMEWLFTRTGWKMGMTKNEVRNSINDAIQQAYRLARLSGDKKALELWKQIPCKGDLPTAEEMVRWLSAKVYEQETNGEQ